MSLNPLLFITTSMHLWYVAIPGRMGWEVPLMEVRSLVLERLRWTIPWGPPSWLNSKMGAWGNEVAHGEGGGRGLVFILVGEALSLAGSSGFNWGKRWWSGGVGGGSSGTTIRRVREGSGGAVGRVIITIVGEDHCGRVEGGWQGL
jgi:hypothetical protein